MVLVNADGAGAVTGLNPFTIRRLAASGKIHIYRHGGAVRFDPDEILNYMRAEGKARPVLTRARMKK